MKTCAAHPEQKQINQRIQRLEQSAFQPCRATLYRYVNPLFHKRPDILNGKGGLVASGRWNLKGRFPVSYTSLSPETALAESLAHARYFSLPLHQALPKVLIALQIDLNITLDLRVGKLRQRLRLSEKTATTTDWIYENQNGKTAITQAWGNAIYQVGAEALIAPSSADSSGVNVMIFPDNLHSSSDLKLLSPVKWQ